MRKNSDTVPAVAEKAELSFVEIPYCFSAKKNGQMISGSTVAVIGTSTLKKIIRKCRRGLNVCLLMMR
jgi:hypothetical protein